MEGRLITETFWSKVVGSQMTKPLEKIVKEYPKRGPLQQFRKESATAFHCFRCGSSKKSKLITVYSDNWNKLLCNGCYGRLLSIYNIKAGTEPEDVKAEALANLLLSLLTEDQAREIAKKSRISEKQAEFLSPQALRFLATSEYVAKSLDASANLDWSPAVIGLCKAFEVEIIGRLLNPLKMVAQKHDLTEDIKDKDFSRIAKYCADKSTTPPELGAIAFFLNTAAHSKSRIERSLLLQSLKSLLSNWPKSNWLIDTQGAILALNSLTSSFRNRAAHTDDLSKNDYENCWSLVVGQDGVLWNLILATSPK